MSQDREDYSCYNEHQNYPGLLHGQEANVQSSGQDDQATPLIQISLKSTQTARTPPFLFARTRDRRVLPCRSLDHIVIERGFHMALSAYLRIKGEKEERVLQALS